MVQTAAAGRTALAAKLVRYLERQLPGARNVAVDGLVQVPGGASRETWLFDATWDGDDGPQRHELVMRRDPTAGPLQSERSLEFQVYSALQGSDVPVPPMYWLEEDAATAERPFFIMGRVPGVGSPEAAVDGRFLPAAEIGAQFARIAAAIHTFDWRAAGLASLDGGPPGSGTASALREVERWERIMRADQLEPRPILDETIRWLKANLPETRRVTIVHGDFRTGNYLVDEQGIRAVVDWEMAHLGDPMEDLGWACMRFWRWGGDDRIGGVLPRDDFFRVYEDAGGQPVDGGDIRFWEVFGNFKMAVICITSAKGFVGHGPVMLGMVGRGVPPLELELLEMLGL